MNTTPFPPHPNKYINPFTDFGFKRLFGSEAFAAGLERGLQQGLEKGRAEGEVETARAIERNLLLSGMDPETVARLTDLPPAEVRALIESSM